MVVPSSCPPVDAREKSWEVDALWAGIEARSGATIIISLFENNEDCSKKGSGSNYESLLNLPNMR
jgi:hypothetical protein